MKATAGAAALLTAALWATVAAAATPPPKLVNPAPTAADWAAIGKLPDWSGVWVPDVPDQKTQETKNPPPWNASVAKQIAQMAAEEDAGRPRPLFVDCLPEAMPSWMLMSHNALEFLFSPGRVTMLGEGDNDRLRRIYTDGRKHSDDPDVSFHGESVGTWDGDTLVVDTVGILPQTYLAISEGVGIRNNGDMRVTERIHLVGSDTLHDDLEIDAPKVLTKPWKTTRIFYRYRARDYEIGEAICLQGNFSPSFDANGNATWTPVEHDALGNPVQPTK